MENSNTTKTVDLTVRNLNNPKEYTYVYNQTEITMEVGFDNVQVKLIDETTAKDLEICSYCVSSSSIGGIPICVRVHSPVSGSDFIDVPMPYDDTESSECELTVIVCNADKSIIIPCDPQVQNSPPPETP